ALALVCMINAAFGQDYHGNHGEGHETWHGKFYETLRTPDTFVSCCNLTDCRPTQGRPKGDQYEVEINGQWVEGLPSKVVKKSAPDGGFHVCAPVRFDGRPEHVYCVVLPPET